MPTGVLGVPRPLGVTPVKTRYAKRHYDQLAGVISKYSGTPDCGSCARNIANDLAKIFKADNPRFKKSLWDKACGID